MRSLWFLLVWTILSGAEVDDLIRKATELSRSGDQPAAEAAAREALRTAPDSAPALALLGVVLTRQEKREKANSYYERALAVDGRLTAARFNLALNQFHLGKLDSAAGNLTQVLKEQPDHSPATLLLGTIVERLHDCARTIALLESVRSLLPQQPDAVLALARCQYAGDRRTEARSTLELLVSHHAATETLLAAVLVALHARDIERADSLLRTIRAGSLETHPVSPTLLR
jgi:Tfp pilus assembly protein PilF